MPTDGYRSAHTEAVMILAYIDPGSGSMVFQMLIAAALAVPFFLREQIGRGIDRIRGRSGKSPQGQPAQDD
jgi:hypothetical protein